MYCKHCGAELPEGNSTCPGCGQAVEKKKEPVMIPLKTVIAIAAVIVLVVALVVVVVVSQRHFGDDPSATTDPVPTIPTDGNPDDQTCKGTYTVTDEELEAQLDVVVATMGDYKLTNGMLQVYYWNQVYDFLSYYGNYVSYVGLDYTQQLDTQIATEEYGTWQQYFLMEAINTWRRYQAFAAAADEAGFELTEEALDTLDSIRADLEADAKEGKYETVQDFMDEYMGPYCTLDEYINYLTLNYKGYMYLESLIVEKQDTITMDDINSYYNEHVEDYEETKEEGELVVDVRHILIFPSEEDKETYTDEEWATCQAKAQEILDEWLAGEATEDSFAKLANKYTEDSGSDTNGGLYTGVVEGQMTTEFNDWIFDESRQYGDYDLVKTQYGYHVMFFVKSEEEWVAEVRTDLLTEYSNELADGILEDATVDIDYSKAALAYFDLAG